MAIFGAIVRAALIIALLATLQSCGAQWHLKRAIKKDPTILNDTIVRIDTTIVTNERRLVDTLIVRDTIVQQSERDGVVVKIQRIHDTIRVDVKCPSDTIMVTKDIPVERVVYKEKPMPEIWKRISFMLYIVFAIMVIGLIIRLIK